MEVWTTYRLQTVLDFLSNIGGSLGLILGMSIMSMASTLIHFCKRNWPKLSVYTHMDDKRSRKQKPNGVRNC